MKIFLMRYSESMILGLWMSYWLIVLIRQVIGGTFLPIHDGILGVVAAIFTLMWLLIRSSKSFENDGSSQGTPVWVIFLGIQASLILQIHQGIPGVEKGIFVGILLGIFTLSAILVYDIPLPGQMSSRIRRLPLHHLPSSQSILRCMFLVGLSLFGIVPFGVFILSQASIPLILGFICSIGVISLGFIGWNTTSPKVENLNVSSISEMIGDTYQRWIFRSLFFGVCVLVGGLGYFLIQEWQAPAMTNIELSVSDIPIRPKLTQLSTSWRINFDQYGLDISSGVPQFLEFTFVSPDSGEAEVEIAAIIQENAGTIRMRAYQEGRLIESSPLISLECQKWFQTTSLRRKIRSDCSPIVDDAILLEFDLLENTEYRIRIETIPYTGQLTFTPDGGVRQGEITIGPPRVFLSDTQK